jgi:hypothetical protein
MTGKIMGRGTRNERSAVNRNPELNELNGLHRLHEESDYANAQESLRQIANFSQIVVQNLQRESEQQKSFVQLAAISEN